MDFVNTCIERVYNNQRDELTTELNRIDFKALSVEETFRFLALLLSAAIQSRHTESMVRFLFDYWGVENPTEDKVSTYTLCYLTPIIEIALLEDVSEVMLDASFKSIALELMQYDDRPEVYTAFQRLEEVYGTPEFSLVESLLNDAELYQSLQARLYLFDVSTRLSASHPAPVPQYILENTVSIQRRLRLHQHKKDPSARRAARFLTEAGLSFSYEDDPSFRRIDNQEILRRLDLITDTELLRILGPVHLQTDANLEGDDICSKYGGCRMLTCNCFERSPDRAGLSLPIEYADADLSDQELFRYADWFMLRQCHQCRRGILSRAYALRIPLPHGGWLGCYCSDTCLRRGIRKEFNEEDLVHRYVPLVVNEIKEKGIYDRRRPKPVEKREPPVEFEETTAPEVFFPDGMEWI